MPQVNATQLRRALAERLGIPTELADAQIRESIVIKGGVYCGRRFFLAGHTLTWFIEENEVKLTGDDGRVLTACLAPAFLSPPSLRQAA
jgi:hypothetical protein